MKTFNFYSATVRLRNGEELNALFNPSGQDGSLNDCYIGYDHNENPIYWNLDGTDMNNESEYDIVEIVS